jgi:hypothetical protein
MCSNTLRFTKPTQCNTRALNAVTACALVTLIGCGADGSGGEKSSEQLRHSRGVARVLVDVSNSFAPFDELKAERIRIVLEAIGDHIVKNWSLGGVMSVHPIDATSVTSAPLCPAVEYESGGLLGSPTADLVKHAAICAQRIEARSKTPARNSDIRNAVNVAATSFFEDAEKSRVLVVVSDFQDTTDATIMLESLSRVTVLMIYGPEKLDQSSNAFQARIQRWRQMFLDAGASRVTPLQLANLTKGEVIAQLPDRLP